MSAEGKTASPAPGRPPAGAGAGASGGGLPVFTRLIDNVEKVILGKREVIEVVVAALLARGHVLVEDLPGVGKTILARAIALLAPRRLPPRAVHARPAAERRHGRLALRPEGAEVPRSGRARCSRTCCSSTR